MITEMLFPENEYIIPAYYGRQCRSFWRMAELAGISVRFIPTGKHPQVYEGRGGPHHFSVVLDGTQIIIDFSDIWETGLMKFDPDLLYFRYMYYNDARYRTVPNLYPLGMFLDIHDGTYEEFFELCKKSSYSAADGIICCNQHPYANALTRRTFVQKMLKERYGDQVNTQFEEGRQRSFWKRIQNSFLSVVVPGACNSMVDRGHVEQFALGICTVAPPLETMFTYFEQPKDGIHYIQCKPDYSDLCEKINWCYVHKDECVRIGKNAAELFQRCYLPTNYFKWIEQVIKETSL